MMHAEPDPVREYVRANLRSHTREAITQQLIAAGHDRARVDAVWREEARAASVSDARGSLTSLSVILLVTGGLIGALGALLIVSINGDVTDPNPLLFLALYAVLYLAIGFGIVRLVRWAVPQFDITGWRATLIGVLMLPAYGVLMFGGCLATYGIAQQISR